MLYWTNSSLYMCGLIDRVRSRTDIMFHDVAAVLKGCVYPAAYRMMETSDLLIFVYKNSCLNSKGYTIAKIIAGPYILQYSCA